MNMNTSSEETKIYRRRFLRVVVITVATAQLGMIGSAYAVAKRAASSEGRKAETRTSFTSLKQIDAGLLNVGYVEAGPADGRPVILLHGWPYDIQSFADVTPLLAVRVIESSFLICAVTAQRDFFQTKLFETVNQRQLLPTSSR
jgi:hypothetical protein